MLLTDSSGKYLAFLIDFDMFKFSFGKLDFTHPANHWSLNESNGFSRDISFLHLANDDFCSSLVFYKVHPKQNLFSLVGKFEIKL